MAGADGLTRAQSQARTRDALLRAGEQIYLEKGFNGSSAATIAERAGHSTGALYSNFASKDDLLISVLDRHSAIEVERLVAAVAKSQTVVEVIAGVSRRALMSAQVTCADFPFSRCLG